MPVVDPTVGTPSASLRPHVSRLVWVVAGVMTLALVAVAGRYGFHGDEFYFIVTGRHLQAAAPDNPMLVPYLAAGWFALVGGHLWAFRILPALAIGVFVALGGLTAREFGVSPRHQVAAAVAVALTAAPLGTGHLFETTTFDLLTTAAALLMLVRALRSEPQRWGPWVAFGVLTGVAMEIKILVAPVLLCCLAGVLLLGPRHRLASPRPWVAVAIALLIAAPNLVWQALHGFPMLHIAANIAGGGSTSSTSRAALIPTILLDIGPLVSIVFITGLVALLRRRRRHIDGWIAAGFLIFVGLVLLTGGKAYYPGGFYPAVLAAGAGPVLDWVLRGRIWRRAMAIGLLIVTLVVTPALALPLARPGSAVFTIATAANPDLAQEIGWPNYVDSVAAVAATIPESEHTKTVVVGQSYALAGALEILRPSNGVRIPPVYSGHNGFWYWVPPPEAATDAIVVGDFTPAQLARGYARCELRQTVTTPPRVDNDLSGTKIYWCTGLRLPWSELWPQLKSFA